MRILNLQNTILVSLFVAGAATSVACGSSDASRPDATAGATAGGASSGAGASATGGYPAPWIGTCPKNTRSGAGSAHFKIWACGTSKRTVALEQRVRDLAEKYYAD